MPSSLRLRPTVVLWRGVLLFVVLGLLAATFLFPVVLALREGWSVGLALAIGLIAFPGLSLAWHLVAELRRRRRPVPAGSLRMIDRLALRTAVSCAAVLSVVALGWGRGAWQALDHARDRFGFTAPGEGMATAPALTSFPRHVVDLVPDDTTSLLAVPHPYQTLGRLADEDPPVADDLVAQAEACDIDITRTSVLGGWSGPEHFLLVVHAPGLNMVALECLVDRAEEPKLESWWREWDKLDVPAATRMRSRDADEHDSSIALYVLDRGGIVLVSPRLRETVEARLAGEVGRSVEDGPLRPWLERVAERPSDAWLVTAKQDADDPWVGSTWRGSLSVEALEIEGRIDTSDEASAEAVRDELRQSLAEAAEQLESSELSVRHAIDVDVSVDADTVLVEADVDLPELVLALWTNGTVQELVNEHSPL